MTCQDRAEPYPSVTMVWFLMFSPFAETILRFPRCQASSPGGVRCADLWDCDWICVEPWYESRVDEMCIACLADAWCGSCYEFYR